MSEMPFGFTWCYEETEDEDEQCLVLIIGDPEEVPPLDIDISNILSDKAIAIRPIDGVTQPDADHYHFKLAFLPGMLAVPSEIAVESADWLVSSVSNQNEDSIYLLWTGAETSLAPQSEMKVILTGVAAQSVEISTTSTEVRTTTTDVTISWEFAQGGIQVVDDEKIPDGGDYDENTTLTLTMVQSTGKSNIPLYVGFVNCNKVLNTYDEASSLQLRLTNTNLPSAADPDITFHYDADINLCSQLVITLDVGTVADVPWALGTQDQVNNITISIAGDEWQQNGSIEIIEVDGVVQGLQWTFIPQGADVVLAARKTMLINLENIITSHPTGEANLYLNYQYVPGYKDGQFVCQIEKAPLTFDNKVRVGMRENLSGLLNVKDGISIHEDGKLRFDTGTYSQMIDLYSENNGIGIQSNTVYFRSGTNFAWYQGGSPTGGEIDPGDGGTVFMVLKNGNLGIGTTAPSDKLHVNGRIKDKTGYVIPVGTIVPYGGESAPQGWLMCNGNSVNSTNYQDLFNVIGHTYGGGGDNFNLPDLEGRVPVGKNTDTFNALGKTGGEEKHTLSIGEMPSHNHDITESEHSHDIPVRDGTSMGHVGTGNAKQSKTYHTGGSKTNITINNKGDGNAHNNLQPYLVINYIIKA